MTSCSFIVLSYLSFILRVSKGSAVSVTQPQTVTVNPDRSVSIPCEHTADRSKIQDVRLNALKAPYSRTQREMLCQVNMPCTTKNMVMYEENPNKYLFFMFNVGPEEMNLKYECQITVEKNYSGADLTTLVKGQKETTCQPTPSAQPQTEQWTVLEFILIGFLAVTLLYGFVITSYFFKQLNDGSTAAQQHSDDNPENSVYVDMRKTPLTRNPVYDMSCG